MNEVTGIYVGYAFRQNGEYLTARHSEVSKLKFEFKDKDLFCFLEIRRPYEGVEKYKIKPISLRDDIWQHLSKSNVEPERRDTVRNALMDGLHQYQFLGHAAPK
ncbi:MAG: hypothetical protein FWF24_07035 [Alphaproteobacteria bacterium]|nr:hypothetical protein [Alphaproteobacteria bacterium]